MWQYNDTPINELCHYGVLGMKWGHRKASQWNGKTITRDALRNAGKKNVEAYDQMYKSATKSNNTIFGKNRRLKARQQAENDAGNFLKTDARYRKMKSQYKAQKAQQKLDSRTTKQTQKAISKLSTGEAIVREMMFGSHGSVVYTSLRAKDVSKGKAAVQAILNGTLNNLTLGKLAKTSKW